MLLPDEVLQLVVQQTTGAELRFRQVMPGMLYAPGVPDSAEMMEMSKLVDTYGKMWHTWQIHLGNTLPLDKSAGWPTTLPSDTCPKAKLQMWQIELLPVSTQSGILCQWPIWAQVS